MICSLAPAWDSIEFHIATSTFDHVGSLKSRRIVSTNWTTRVRQTLSLLSERVQ